MKLIFAVLLTSMIFTNQISSMDKQTNQTYNSLDEMIDTINKTINETYSLNNLVANFLYSNVLPTRYYADILTIPNKCYNGLKWNKTVLNKLCQKNSFFADAINHFSALATEEFKQVTPNTINTIDSFVLSALHTKFQAYIKCLRLENQKRSQLPTQLDQSIAAYIIDVAKVKTDYSYEIELNIGAPVIDFDICPTTDIAAVSSGNEKTSYRLCLWDLKTITPFYTLEEEKPVSKVCFNNNGSQLASIVHANEKSRIKIWSTISKHLLHIINPDTIPHHIIYIDGNANILCVGHQNNLRDQPTTLWSINEDNYNYLGITPLYFDGFEKEKNYIVRKNYRGRGIYHSTLFITKNNCHDMHVCKKAQNKARIHDEFKLIKNSNPYKKLTTYEQHTIDQQFK